MKTRPRLLQVGLPAAALAVLAPSGTCWDGEKPFFVRDLPPADGALSWEGKPGRSYFVQHSDDLVIWLYQPEIWSGDGTAEAALFDCSASALFTRLRFTDLPTSDPALADFDNDGVASWDELDPEGDFGTDPLDPDSDHDGTPDGIDSDALDANVGGNLLEAMDSDSDGVSNAGESLRGTSPLLADSDGDNVPDGADAFPLDPARSASATMNPNDTTAPVVTLESPSNAEQTSP